MRVPRGKTSGTQKVALPDGYLDSWTTTRRREARERRRRRRAADGGASARDQRRMRLPTFRAVREAFREELREHGEIGAAVGGHVARPHGRRTSGAVSPRARSEGAWTEHTLVNVYSSTQRPGGAVHSALDRSGRARARSARRALLARVRSARQRRHPAARTARRIAPGSLRCAAAAARGALRSSRDGERAGGRDAELGARHAARLPRADVWLSARGAGAARQPATRSGITCASRSPGRSLPTRTSACPPSTTRASPKLTRPLGRGAAAWRGGPRRVSWKREPDSLTALRVQRTRRRRRAPVNTRAWRAAEIPASNGHATAMGSSRDVRGARDAERTLEARESSARKASRALLRCSAPTDRTLVLRVTTRFGPGFMLSQPEGSGRIRPECTQLSATRAWAARSASRIPTPRSASATS